MAAGASRTFARAAAVQENAARVAARRSESAAALMAQSVTLADAARRTGSSQRYLQRLVRQGDALAFEAEGLLRLPVWQLQGNGVSPVVPGLRDLLNAFPGGLAALHRWALQPHVDLHGRTPAQGLQREKTATVIALASAIAAAGR